MKYLIKVSLLITMFLFTTEYLHSQNFSQMHVINPSVSIMGLKAIAADLDNDLDADVLVVSRVTPTYVCWFENIDSGEFGDQMIISSKNNRDVYVIDIDNDTYNDVITCDWDNLYWYRNNQDGTFELGQELPGSPGGYDDSPPYTVCSADLNGDAYNDLISLWEAPNPGLNTVLNLGNGQFGPLSGIWSSVETIYPVDLDDDGDIDLIASDFELAFFENINGSIYNRSVLNEDYSPDLLVSADIDLDGDMDIVGTNFYDPWVRWFENDGNTHFEVVHTVLEVDSTYGPNGIFICDLDNDADQDIICCFWGWNLLGWFENDGYGNFGELKTISSDYVEPESVYCADFDNDGDMDVLSTSWSDDRVVWFENDLNTGLEEIDEEIHFSLYPNPTSGIIYISSEKNLTGSNVKIYNLAGQSVNQLILTDYSVPVQDLKNGVYFLGIETDKGVLLEKFILSKNSY